MDVNQSPICAPFTSSADNLNQMQPPDTTPTVRRLYYQQGAELEELIDYGAFRYHLLLKYNTVERNCAENVLLRKAYRALDIEDESTLNAVGQEVVDLLLPFVMADYSKRKQSNDEPSANETIKLQAVTQDGIIGVINHNNHLQYPPTNPVENEYPGVKTVPATEVEKLEKIDDDIFKVKVHDEIYCMKGVHQTVCEGNFQREIKVLQKCSHPNIIRLIGLVVNTEDRVEAMLMEYVENAKPLSGLGSISRDEFGKWTQQMREAISYLHEKNLVWGDAKASNVLIREDGSIVLIDFGGGYTKGWVESNNYETSRGDWQGFERICTFLEARVVEGLRYSEAEMDQQDQTVMSTIR